MEACVELVPLFFLLLLLLLLLLSLLMALALIYVFLLLFLSSLIGLSHCLVLALWSTAVLTGDLLYAFSDELADWRFGIPALAEVRKCY